MINSKFLVLFVFITSFLFSNDAKESCVSLENKVTFSSFDSFQFNKGQLNLLPKSTTNAIVYHDFYTLSYDEKYEQSEWVAYELKKEQVVNANFKRPFFIQDKKVKTGSADWRNYKN